MARAVWQLEVVWQLEAVWQSRRCRVTGHTGTVRFLRFSEYLVNIG